MADYERSKHQRGNHLDSTGQSRKPERSADSDSYDTHGLPLRSSREGRTPHQGHSQMSSVTHREPHSQSNDTSDRGYHRYDKSEDRYSGSITKHHRWISHDRPKTIYSHIHERDMSNGHRTINPDAANERRGQYSPIHRQDITVEKPHERYDRRDEERRRHRDSEHFRQKSHYKYNKEAEQEYQESRSPACAHSYSSHVTSLKTGHHKLDIDDLDEQTDQQQSTADHRSEHRHHRSHHQSSRGRPSSRRSSSHTSSNASQDSHDSRGTVTPKEGSSSRRRPSQRSWDGSRSPSHSRSRPRSESRHRGRSRSRSPSQNHSNVNKSRQSSHGDKHSNKRKHKDRSASRDGHKRRRDREREGEREKGREREWEKGRKGERDREREKEKRKKKDEEKRSVLTGKKIKLKVKKDKGDHERDANRKDLLQFLNSAFE